MAGRKSRNGGRRGGDEKAPPTQTACLLDFIEWKRFTKDWQDLRLNDDALSALQFAIMADPRAGAVIEGTGGLRKLRFAPSTWKKGKSGAARICFVYFEEHALVFLLRAYAKKDKDDLNDSERVAIKNLILSISAGLAKRSPPT